MGRIFLDTSFILSFVDKNDEHYSEARESMKEFLEEELIISDYIYLEALNTVYSRSGHRKAKNLAEYLRKSEINIVQSTENVIQKSNNHFKEKDISFTDCTVPPMMDVLDIDKLATFDNDFEKFETIEMVP